MPIDLEALAEELGLEAYPAHPAKWSGRGKEAFLEAESSYRTPSPAPVRQGPATPGNQPLTGEVPGGAGDLPGEKPGIGLGDEDRHKPPRRSGLPGLPGGAGNPEVLFVNRSTPEGLGELLLLSPGPALPRAGRGNSRGLTPTPPSPGSSPWPGRGLPWWWIFSGCPWRLSPPSSGGWALAGGAQPEV